MTRKSAIAALAATVVAVTFGLGAAPAASASPHLICGYYVTSKNGLNLRASWSKESTRRATMPYGATFAAATDITHSNEGILWREVYDYNGLSGWADNGGMTEYTC